ncbi:Longin domain [Macleaya cordata]|uniref:Longin domain n=1 Tax=Macleaya cordata TaxID=56857 RepID=A0A200QCL8_MACCD|nr:Longin domain [Macleaya cordata]
MVSDQNLVLYACVSTGKTVLAEVSSSDRDLETLALQCLEKTPDFHISYSHTVRKRIYSFLMEDPFVYFAIADEEFGNSQSFQFLERAKHAFLKMLKTKSSERFENLTSHCFHEEFNPIFRCLMDSTFKSNSLQSSVMSSRNSRNDSHNSRKQSKNSKKKKTSDEMDERGSDIPIENTVDISGAVNQSREFSTSLLKNGSYIKNVGLNALLVKFIKQLDALKWMNWLAIEDRS